MRHGECGAAGPVQDHFERVAVLDQPVLLMSLRIVQVKEALKIIFRARKAPMVAFSKYCHWVM